jgi:hypothetical protein
MQIARGLQELKQNNEFKLSHLGSLKLIIGACGFEPPPPIVSKHEGES